MAEDKNIRRRKVRRMMRGELLDKERKRWERDRRRARREKARRLYGEEE